jgi:spermidine synthase
MGQNLAIKKVCACILIVTLFLPNLSADSDNKSFWDSALSYIYKPITFILPHYETRKILFETETQYFNIRVEESETGLRHLVFLPRKGSQSIYDTTNPKRIYSTYIDYSLLAFPALNRKPKNILFIGMGGGIMPMTVRREYPNVNIDIVEIDKEIPKIAEKYFGFKSDKRINIIIEDGRVFVNKCKKKYDAVFIDVYNAENIPFQFTTVEFYEQIKRILVKDGVCAVNVANMGKQNFIDLELNTIMHVFSNTYVFVCPGKTNYVPIMVNGSSMNYQILKENAIKFDSYHKFPVQFNELINDTLTNNDVDKIERKEALILTDDYAPIYRLN